MAKHLDLLTCGGNITSAGDPEDRQPAPTLVGSLVQELWQTAITHTRVSAVDSAASTPSSWTQILDAVRSAGDGPVLITHGTDTLGWTAAALAVTDVASDRPVVMTGANVPFGEPKSDASNNLEAALTVCRQLEKGVWVVFAGTVDGPAVVIEGGFARKTLPDGSCITDVSGSPFATVNAEVLARHRKRRGPVSGASGGGTAYSHDVVAFGVWPGIRLPEEPPADRIVVELYDLSSGPENVIATLSRWTSAGVEVVVVPSSPHQEAATSGAPQPVGALGATGAVLQPGLTLELAVCSRMLS